MMLPGNSQIGKSSLTIEPEKKPGNDIPESKGIVEGKLVKEKGLKRLLRLFVKCDAKSLREYMIEDFLVPYLERGFKDAVNSALDLIIDNKKRDHRSSGNYNPYNRSSLSPSVGLGYSRNAAQMPQSNPYIRDYNNILLNNRGDAERVIRELRRIAYEFGKIKLSDLYEMVSIRPASTDFSYGWYSADNFEVHENSDGSCYLVLPRPILFN